MVRDPEVCALVRNIMMETEAVAAKLGMELPVTIDQRIAGAEKVGEHKTSMLQALGAGRPMEIESIAGAVVELGDRPGVPMPRGNAILVLMQPFPSRRSLQRLQMRSLDIRLRQSPEARSLLFGEVT